MQNSTRHFILTHVFLLCTFGFIHGQPATKIQNYYTQGNSNRTAAEWEPAIGTLITWPLCIPHKLAIELAKDNHLFTLVDNVSSQQEAMIWYEKWGIRPEQNTFIMAPQGIDAWWTRDWGPSAVFTPEGKMYLGDGKYVYSTPNSGLGCHEPLQFLFYDEKGNIIQTTTDDNATIPIGKALQIPVMDLPFITTGGNVITDGMGTAFSSCILLNENRFFRVPEERFFTLNDSLAGFKNYHILSNFEMLGIQHVDCLMKLLDPERILVAEPPHDHELYPLYEKIVEKELKNLTNVFGRPYKIFRIKTGRYENDLLAAYTNSIIVNKNIYVPLFNIEEDAEAIRTWQKLMPGYTVKGFTFDFNDEPVLSDEMKEKYPSGYGWTYGDALHCRTRAVWDAEMLFIAVKQLPEKGKRTEPLTVYVSIIDYSKKGLTPGSGLLYWRVKGETDWKTEPLIQGGSDTGYYAVIPVKSGNESIEYYISAASLSGKTEMSPRTAPTGFYTTE